MNRWRRLLGSIERNERKLFARDVIEASPLAQEILNARPYAFLDDAPLEERRTRAVQQRRWLDPQTAKDMGKLDQGAIDRVRDEAWPRVENADELHDALVELGFLAEQEGSEWQQFFAELKNDRRAAVLQVSTGSAGVPPALSAQREQIQNAALNVAYRAHCGRDARAPSVESMGCGGATAAIESHLSVGFARTADRCPGQLRPNRMDL